MCHHPLELRAERPLVALGQALELEGQMLDVERRNVTPPQRRHLPSTHRAKSRS
jgi:hypothetical protein